MKKLLVLALALGVVTGTGACASRKYARTQATTATDRLNSQLTPKIEANSGEIKETQDAVNLVRQRVAGVDQRVTSVDQRVGIVDEKVANVDQRVTGVDQKVAVVDSHVATVGGRVEVVDQKVARVDDKVKNVGDQVVSLDNKTTQQITDVRKDVGAVDQKTDRAMNDINHLDGKFENRNNLVAGEQKAIMFGFDKDKLDKAGIAELDMIAEKLMANRDAIVVLEGRTDSTGDRDYNIALGERRVEQVRRYLAVDKNVPVFKIHPISLGTARPIADNKSAEGRAQNRSVLVTIMAPPSSQNKVATQAARD
jgi:outer membrane protein OmpA-like peptidoglycan-associated protein